MTVIALSVPTHSRYPVSLEILVVIIFLAALAAAGYHLGRKYIDNRTNRRY